MARNYAYRLALDEGVTVGTRTLLHRKIADLALPSGRVVACDPFVELAHAKPFALPVPPGTYPVYLSAFEDFDEDPSADIELATVRFGTGRVARWANARTGLAAAGADDEAYGVDSGTGCFCDPAAQRALARDDGLLERARDAGYRERAYATVPAGGANLVVFKSGAGDGAYPSYAGYDAQGRLLALVTDFAGSDLNDRARGGPWDESLPAAERLSEAWAYLLNVGGPEAYWLDEYLPARDLSEPWAASADGATMRAMLEAAEHPALAAVLGAEIAERVRVYESLDAPEFGQALRALGARLAAGAVPPGEAVGELNRIEAAQERAVRKRFPMRTSEQQWRASLGEAVAPEAFERVRAARREGSARLAEAIRGMVPSPPSLDALVAAVRANGDNVRGGRW